MFACCQEYLPNFCLGRSFTFIFFLLFFSSFFNKSSLHFLFPLGVANTRSRVDPHNKNRSQCSSSHMIDIRSCVESQQSMKSRENLRVFFVFVSSFSFFDFFCYNRLASMLGLLFGKMRFQHRLEGGNTVIRNVWWFLEFLFVCRDGWVLIPERSVSESHSVK